MISPLHSLNLYVNNNDKKPSEEQSDVQSMDGFVSFESKDLGGMSFTVKVEKTKAYQNRFMHFSIIASTTGSNLRLEPSVSHYETIAPNTYREFVFEFDKKAEYLVNFYTHNMAGK